MTKQQILKNAVTKPAEDLRKAREVLEDLYAQAQYDQNPKAMEVTREALNQLLECTITLQLFNNKVQEMIEYINQDSPR